MAAEFLITSATSGDDGLGVLPANERILQRNPSVRMLEDRRGYGICQVMPQRRTTELISLSQVTSAQTPSRTVTRFVVEPGRVGSADRDTRS